MNVVELVAHRAGNSASSARRAAPLVDVIELDVHVFRGRVETRHAKVLWPTGWLWEKWYILPPGTRGTPIDDVLAVLDPGQPLMIDLKCFSRRAARRIERAVPRSHPVIASTRSWWILAVFGGRPATRRLRSCRSRRQLWFAMRVARLGADDGLSVHHSLLSEQVVAEIADRTDQLFTWGVGTAGRGSALVRAGVRGLIVDDVDLEWPRRRDQPGSGAID